MAQPSESVQAAFGLFDDDSSDDEQQVGTTTETLSILPLPAPVATTPQDAATADEQEQDVPSLYAPWDDVKPLAVGPIELVTNCRGIGGHRGYIATRDLEPGTQVLVEQVYVPWPDDVEQSDPSFFIATLETILSREDYKDIMQHLGHLHPQQLNELPDELLAAGREKYGELLTQLRRDFQHLELSEDALLQNVFAMQCNAFDSGVFLYNAMFNHDCNPNCVKFTPESTANGISEVRVAKKILKGEALTISYLYPREQSRENRQQNLREQFGFVCICELCRRGDSVLPPPQPSNDTEDGGARVEMKELEKILGAAEELLKDRANVAQVLQIALETLSDALEIVAHDHIVFIRIHKLVADSCDLLLRAKPNQDIREYAILFLRSSYELLELQRAYLNENHMDLARTLNDVSQGIQLLLSYDPNALLEEFSEWKDFRQASFVENQYRQDYRRIKRLYE
ncbi:putative set-domain transcriptional regulator protein, zn-binding site, partial [Globisporangium splendens]